MTSAKAVTKTAGPDHPDHVRQPGQLRQPGQPDQPGDPGNPRSTGRWIEDWHPEDESFWRRTGRRIATRNLIFSILAEHLAFSVWLLWSVVVVSLPAVGFAFSVDQLFWLVAVPSLVGSVLRVPYTFAVPRFGGRNWTVASALLLVVPTGLLAFAVSDPGTPYWFFVLVAATAGLGGGNFASSMTNMSFFYPERSKGIGLGLNAAGGNLGTSSVQFLVPIVINAGAGTTLAFAGLMWLPLILVSAVCAWLFMDNLAVSRAPVQGQVGAAKRPHTWVMAVLYVGTFGSYIGYSAAFPLLATTVFPDSGATRYAFLGALVGSLLRPVGGLLADRFGGARVTFVVFVVMAAGMALLLVAVESGSLALFVTAFGVLFAASGVGNGSTYRMVPAIFRRQGERAERAGVPDARRTSLTEAGAAIGIISAVGAFGGFLIPRAYGASLSATGSVATAVTAYGLFYVFCLGVTWWFYLRRRVLAARLPSLADVSV
ncbi:MFS transporter [Actinopolymorpha pittospori]|uniref:NNP family nitrate/nitrite transporter-like MFS transporter n=1 Tax=Actinopolymorpha pittospori TaxID=648752 RepID=A0A927N4H4_9ACTN|nr:NNP family nitrate/nitrite transporter-like MFS transporter [Actinopolymorpha pittospori]